jgi:hypothetical protein
MKYFLCVHSVILALYYLVIMTDDPYDDGMLSYDAGMFYYVVWNSGHKINLEVSKDMVKKTKTENSPLLTTKLD